MTGISFDVPVDPIERIDLLLQGSEHRAAWAEMSRLIGSSPTTANCNAVAAAAARLDTKETDLTPLTVAVLANFTAEPLAPILAARGLPSRLLITPYVGGFDLWNQEVLTPDSGLRRRDPEVVVMALRLESLCPSFSTRFLELTSEEIRGLVAETAARIEEALTAFRTWSRAKVLLHSVPLPTDRALGVLDAHSPLGQSAAIHRLNERLRRVAETIPDVWIVDVDRLVASLGEQHFYDPRLWAVAKMPFTPTALHALAEEYLRYFRAFTGLVRKVLVLDLDGTLWGGILGEDGPEGIQLGDRYPGSAYLEFQQAVLTLHRRGVVLAVNSKNNMDDVREVFEKHPAMVLRPEHFAAMRVNWQDKVTNMLELAEELRLGIESFVFMDDSNVECERMRQALPEVLTIHLEGESADRAGSLKRVGVFDSLSYSEEDRNRGAFYRGEVERAQLRKSVQSLDDFYRSLEMELTIQPIGAATMARAADLSQRTNQFNLTTRRYTRDELAAAIAYPGCEAYGFRLTDRFGDNGLIAFAILEGQGQTLTISSLLMSCRVLKRTAEDAVLAFLVERAHERGATEIAGRYRPTKKNGQVADFYPTHGFSSVEDEAGGVRVFCRSTAPPPVYPPWIRITRLAPPQER